MSNFKTGSQTRKPYFTAGKIGPFVNIGPKCQTVRVTDPLTPCPRIQPLTVFYNL